MTTAAEMFTGAAPSTANYNKMLYSWAYGQATDGVENGASTGVVDNVNFSAGSSRVLDGQPATARNPRRSWLVDHRWRIDDVQRSDSTNQRGRRGPVAISQHPWTASSANPAVSSYRVRAFHHHGRRQVFKTPTGTWLHGQHPALHKHL